MSIENNKTFADAPTVHDNKNSADARPSYDSLVKPDKFAGEKVFVFVEIENIYNAL